MLGTLGEEQAKELLVGSSEKSEVQTSDDGNKYRHMVFECTRQHGKKTPKRILEISFYEIN